MSGGFFVFFQLVSIRFRSRQIPSCLHVKFYDKNLMSSQKQEPVIPMEKLHRWPQLALFAIVLIILGGVVVFRPFWGFMDDASHIFTLVPQVERAGLFQTAWQYGIGDLSWGMFRPTYPLMVYPLYKPGMMFGPAVTFFLNAIFAIFCLYSSCSILARITNVRREWVLLSAAAFFYQYDLFQSPSLQEKLILLSGAALLRLAWGPLVVNRLTHFFLFAFVFIFGVCVKASFMIFFSMALWAFFSAHKTKLFERKDPAAWAALAGFAIAGICSLAFLAMVSAKEGSYTAHDYSAAKIVPNLLSLEGALFLSPLLLFAIWVIREPKLFLAEPWRLTAFWGVLAFLVIFLPWGIKAYVQSVIGAAFACLCVQLADGLFRRLPAYLWQIPLTALALCTAAYRIPTMFIRLHDIGRAVDSISAWESKGVKEIFLPSCGEGAVSMQLYVKELAHSAMKVSLITDFHGVEGKAIFYDLALCPFPGRVKTIPGCASQEEIFEGGLKKSFRLAKGKGCS